MEIEYVWKATIGVTVIVLLGYLVGVLSSKFDLRPRIERRYLLPESEDEARARYRAAWQEYRKLRILFPVAFLGWLPFVIVLSAVFSFFHLSGNIAGVVWVTLALAWIPFMSISSWRWANWKCPRCGQAFKWSYDHFFPKHCHYCNLPMWAESPDE